MSLTSKFDSEELILEFELNELVELFKKVLNLKKKKYLY